MQSNDSGEYELLDVPDTTGPLPDHMIKEKEMTLQVKGGLSAEQAVYLAAR